MVNERVRWVKVSIDPRSNNLQVDSNASFESAVALLEVGKQQLITNATRAPTPDQGSGKETLAAARIPGFRPEPIA